MNGNRFRSRRVGTVGAVLVVLAVAGGITWYKTRGAAAPPQAVVPAGPPVVKDGVTLTPVRAAGAPAGQVDGYGLGLSADKANALKNGKTVIVPAPGGGTIEVRAVEPTPPTPGGKK